LGPARFRQGTGRLRAGDPDQPGLCADLLQPRLAYYERRDYDRAISDLNQAINGRPNYPLAFNIRGLAYLAKGETDRGIQDFDQAIRLDAKFAVALNNRGEALLGKKDLDRAIADFDQAIKANPNYDVAFYNRGIAYRDKRDFERSASDFSAAININRRTLRRTTTAASPIGTRQQRQRHRRLRAGDQARPEIRGGLRQSRHHLLRQARLCPRHRRFRPGNQAQSQQLDALHDRGLAYRDKGDAARAIADFDQAIKLDPKFAAASRAVASPTATSRTTTAPSPISTMRSGSTPNSPGPSTIAAWSTRRPARPIAPSPTSHRRSGSTPITISPTQSRPALPKQGRRRSRHRRLQPGRQGQPEIRCRLQQPRLDL